MPYKHHQERRHKIPKQKYRLTNSAQYNEALRQRGDLTIWLSDDALDGWHAERRKTPGGQQVYSNLAIELCLTLRLVYQLPLRQTQGFMRSIARLLNIDISIPDYSTLSRRAPGLKIINKSKPANQPVTLIVDSTGLKVSGSGEWCAEKHGCKPRKSWRKLHIGIDLNSGEILCFSLTTQDVGDTTALPDLLHQPIATFIADGAYDGQPVNDILTNHFGDIEIVIPPPKNAKRSDDPKRNARIEAIKKKGRIGWQKTTGYNKRSVIESHIGRYKKVIGGTLKSRNFENQQCETAVAVNVLNQMNAMGRAQFSRIF